MANLIRVKGNSSATPNAPAQGVVLYFNGTQLIAKNAANQTVTLTNRTGNAQTWA